MEQGYAIAALCFGVFATITDAALPPGYDTELLCPKDSCLRSKEVPRGFAGPKTSFWECFEESSGQTHAPATWGFRLPQERKDALLEQGYFPEVYCSGAEKPSPNSAGGPDPPPIVSLPVEGEPQPIRGGPQPAKIPPVGGEPQPMKKPPVGGGPQPVHAPRVMSGSAHPPSSKVAEEEL
ncbi:hypothetical protein CYMTET_11471 [Cymbomonas tetramitiformis]|uniref:Uncharacterized protein n=1 Tax=Cymbomonas tetramitiformis TaxID=36881 RepID=A0AAE0GNM7_9CHLO|nr:hypothetical protein CYMTET_11471 [Cymbomonas tetramitiformis]